MAIDQVMEMMNSLSPEELQMVRIRAKNLVGNRQQATNENSTNSDELILPSPITRINGFNSSRSTTIPGVREARNFSEGGRRAFLSNRMGTYFNKSRKCIKFVKKKWQNLKKSQSRLNVASSLPGATSPASTKKKEERDMISTVRMKKEYVHMERVDGIPTNVVQGLELYDDVFNPKELEEIVRDVEELQKKGKKREFKATRTYSETARWLLGKGGSTMQFGSYYAEDRKGNPPGKLTNEVVDPMPPPLEEMIQKLVDHNILHANRKPDNCVVNIYNIGDCLPPDTYHADFHRPTCTVSLVIQCNILFGANTNKNGTEISAPLRILLPAGSVLVLNGNAANVAKQCVTHMSGKRISITFRKMDESKLPLKKTPDTGLKSKSASREGSSPLDPIQNQIDSIMSDNGAEVVEDSDEKLSTER